MGNFIRHEACPNCGSKDNLAIYDDESYYCFTGCGYVKRSREFEDKNRDFKKESILEEDNRESLKKVKEAITEDKKKSIQKETSKNGKCFRGLKNEITTEFGVRYSYNEETGEVAEQYYPCTKNKILVGYKVRTVPKSFYSIGNTGADCELFGQFKFKKGGKYVLIVEGELCQLSAYQMLLDYNKQRGSDFEVAVVSATTGANSYKQIASQYDFLNSFEQIILALDNDEAGEKASEKVLKVLPKGKVKIMTFRYKDSNEYLMKDKAKEFIKDFYSAKEYVPVGIVGSGDIFESMREEFMRPKLTLPSFMHRLQEAMAGGVPLGTAVNIASASGTGKSTICDEIVYHTIFNTQYKVGIVTLESTCSEYGNKLLSRHIGIKLYLKDNLEALKLLDSDEIKPKKDELFRTENGEHRFFIIDDRDGSVENIKDKIENLIISCGCKVIILDPVQDIVGRLSNEEQESFYSWQKGLMKSHLCTFYNIMHTRKKDSKQKAGSIGGDLHEEDIQGSSSAYKSAACNLIFTRDKEAEDTFERNTTYIKATKIRWTGKTGVVGSYYYDNETHTMHDVKDYLQSLHSK